MPAYKEQSFKSKTIDFLMRRNGIIIFILIGLLGFLQSSAQKKVPLETREITYPPFNLPDTVANKDFASQKDIFDAVGALFKKGSKETVDTDTSLTKPIISIVPAIGYS